MRSIYASKDTFKILKSSKAKKLEITSFFYIDPYNETSNKWLNEWKRKLTGMPVNKRKALMDKMGTLKSPLIKKDMKKYNIFCKKCGAYQGYVYATNKKLTNWCNFHYFQYTDGLNWFGCYTPHVSPITGKLCLECCCGNDTRDFSANNNLPSKVSNLIEKSNKIGRDFGKSNSKFIAK